MDENALGGVSGLRRRKKRKNSRIGVIRRLSGEGLIFSSDLQKYRNNPCPIHRRINGRIFV